ncbi:sugar phosphate isomerase/epimerase [Psychromarinibacter sp. C21-152]|uniref:Sugar phosphate isomerase/epimerase n=1 Tax=Psychromarinibacter sediminicola TaxID=3033385 RepID=A0AAE3NQY4_9RHOB|nr:sugar phosphate isomerase/epimerase [Psychromarinibacter sediminicola]MDF0600446.1 sugar phosphate isomerase/epimerase [Psychromarinibacter sediminicola]
MRLSLASWSVPRLTLPEAAEVALALGIGALDISTKGRPGLDKAEILADPRAAADRVRRLGVACPNYFHHFGADHADRNLALPGSVEANARDLAQVLTFCDAAGIGTVFVLPGRVNPGQSRAEALEAAADSLSALLAVARDFAAELCIEPVVHSVADSPAAVRALVDRTGVRLALDPSHLICLGHPQETIEPLAAHAAHVHLRQARPGALQARMAEGTIDFPAFFAALRQAGYDGALAIEYLHPVGPHGYTEDVLTETVAMRDAFRAWADGGA